MPSDKDRQETASKHGIIAHHVAADEQHIYTVFQKKVHP